MKTDGPNKVSIQSITRLIFIKETWLASIFERVTLSEDQKIFSNITNSIDIQLKYYMMNFKNRKLELKKPAKINSY